jgi:hypothetical protein
MMSPSERMIALVEDGGGWLVFNNLERCNAVSVDMCGRQSQKYPKRGHKRGQVLNYKFFSYPLHRCVVPCTLSLLAHPRESDISRPDPKQP